MIKHTVKTIHRFRIAFLILITIGFFYTLGLNPVNISLFVGAKLGQAVGMSTSVPENPFNKLAAQLKDKEERLDIREADISKREQEIAQGTIARQRVLIYIMGAGLVILFVLVIINYYLDFKRKQKGRDINTE